MNEPRVRVRFYQKFGLPPDSAYLASVRHGWLASLYFRRKTRLVPEKLRIGSTIKKGASMYLALLAVEQTRFLSLSQYFSDGVIEKLDPRLENITFV